MPPLKTSEMEGFIKDTIAAHDVVVFTKTWCVFSQKAKNLLDKGRFPYYPVELDLRPDGPALQAALTNISAITTVPQIFIKGKLIGDFTQLDAQQKSGELAKAVEGVELRLEDAPYDLIVIGGGSGGMACGKEARRYSKRVLVLDYVKPTPIGTKWGLGGTCVNVGCIPKKLMHTAGSLGDLAKDMPDFGWQWEKCPAHDWNHMVENIQNYIYSLNFAYKSALMKAGIDYVNGYGRFHPDDPNKIIVTKKTAKETKEVTYSAKNILISTGLRPKYPDDCEGAREFGISSDDIFSLKYSPGKTLCVGASYVSLECAGFLHGIGLETHVMVRSILLRGFDQEIAEKIGDQMKTHGVKFFRPCVPKKIEQLEPRTDKSPGKYRVTALMDGKTITEEYNTVIFAIGRDPATDDMDMDKVPLMESGKVVGRGLVRNGKKNNKVVVDSLERTNVGHIYAVGDVADGRLELTPVAIQAGRLLAKRLFVPGFTREMDYTNVPTTVFTPLEYGACGLSEEEAKEKYGDDAEVYQSPMGPLEYSIGEIPTRRAPGFCKLITLKSENERVIGFHVLGPNAGEVTQGYGTAMKAGATKAMFDDTVGIHPTNAEIFTDMDNAKSSGRPLEKSSC